MLLPEPARRSARVSTSAPAAAAAEPDSTRRAMAGERQRGVSDPEMVKRSSLRGVEELDIDAGGPGGGADGDGAGRGGRRSVSDTGPAPSTPPRASPQVAPVDLRNHPLAGGPRQTAAAHAGGLPRRSAAQSRWPDDDAGDAAQAVDPDERMQRPRVLSDSDRWRGRTAVGTMHELEVGERARAGSLDRPAPSRRTSVARSPRGYSLRGMEIAHVVAEGAMSVGVLLPGEWIRMSSRGSDHRPTSPPPTSPSTSPREVASARVARGSLRLARGARSEEAVGGAGSSARHAAIHRTRTRKQSLPNMSLSTPFASVSREDTAELRFAFDWRGALRAAVEVGVLPLLPLLAALAGLTTRRGGRQRAPATAAECLAAVAFVVAVTVQAAVPAPAVSAPEVAHAACVHVLFIAVVALRRGLGSDRPAPGSDGSLIVRQLADAERRSGTDLAPHSFLFAADRHDAVLQTLRASGAATAYPQLKLSPGAGTQPGSVPARLVVACILLSTLRAEGADESGHVPLGSWERAARATLCAAVALLPIVVRAARGEPPIGADTGSAVATLLFAFAVFVHLYNSYADAVVRHSLNYFRRRALVLAQLSRLLAGTWVPEPPGSLPGPAVVVVGRSPRVSVAASIIPTLLSAGSSTQTGLQAIDMLSSRNLTVWYWARDVVELWGAGEHRMVEAASFLNLLALALALGTTTFQSLSGVHTDPLLICLGALYVVAGVGTIASSALNGYAANLEAPLNVLALRRAKLRLDEFAAELVLEFNHTLGALTPLPPTPGAPEAEAGRVVLSSRTLPSAPRSTLGRGAVASRRHQAGLPDSLVDCARTSPSGSARALQQARLHEEQDDAGSVGSGGGSDDGGGVEEARASAREVIRQIDNASAALHVMAETLEVQAALRPLTLFGVTLGPVVLRITITALGGLGAVVAQSYFRRS